jgi:amino acid adenylation domain-containing protein
MDRSDWWVAAFLGILKCGAAYVPLDPTYPRERLDYMLDDAGCSVVITETRHLGLLAEGAERPVPDIQVLDIQDLAFHKGTGKLPPGPAVSDIAYVIYTSGSTGQPKGVLLEHGGAVNLAFAQREGLGITAESRILQFAPSSFDASVWEILMALMQGACLVIAGPERIRDPQEFGRYLGQHQVTVATLPPSYLAQLSPEDLGPLQLLVTAGEPPNLDQALLLSRRLRYVNAYGPTETSVCATWHTVDPDGAYAGSLPIGKPIGNMEVLVLDSHGNLAPIGIPGEIHIGGRGLARGYHNRPGLTASAFVPHPLRPEDRLYRTGDLGVVRSDGEIVFLGRNDAQVKIRGHRIERGEIERCLLRHPQVEQAAVTVRRPADGLAELAAYVVAAPGVTVHALRAHLEQSLPAYMIPAAVMVLDALPLLPNGKVDASALPDPAAEAEAEAPSEAPAAGSELEKQVAAAWAEVLGRPGLKPHDRFFDVGGDSIKAIQIVSRLRRAGLTLSMRDFLQYPTIAGLAQCLGGQRQEVPSGDAEAARRELPFWTAVLSRPVPALPVDGAGGASAAATAELTLPEQTARDLLGPANSAYNTAAPDILLTALARALERWHGGQASRILLAAEAAPAYPFVLDLHAAGEPGAQIKHVKEDLRRVPRGGAGYAVLAGLPGSGLPEAAPEIAFRINSPKLVGAPLEIACTVDGGLLRVAAAFDTARHRRETVAVFLDRFREELLGVVAHCLGRQEAALTASDVSDVPLSVEEFEGLFGND